DYYENFEAYVAAKENITRFQTADDFLIFNDDHPVPAAIAARTSAQLRAFSMEHPANGCYLRDEIIIRAGKDGDEELIPVSEIPLPGKFNVQNVLAAAAAASLYDVTAGVARDAIRSFNSLPHRLERAGTYRGITFYDDSIATVPEATLAA